MIVCAKHTHLYLTRGTKYFPRGHEWIFEPLRCSAVDHLMPASVPTGASNISLSRCWSDAVSKAAPMKPLSGGFELDVTLFLSRPRTLRIAAGTALDCERLDFYGAAAMPKRLRVKGFGIYWCLCLCVLLCDNEDTSTSRTSLSARQAHQSSSISPPQGSRYFRGFRWLTIPFGLGFAYLAYQHLRSIQNGDKTSQVVASDLQVSFYTMLPLRMASRWWGWANDIELPLWVRSPILRFFSWMFCCNIHEAEVDDLRQYRNLGEFFRRALKPGIRPVHARGCVVSPADGTILHFGRIEKGFVEQVKGITYSLPRFLGPHPWDPHCQHSGDEEEYHQKLLQSQGTDLYHCVVYLAPGDYHRFHSPVQWEVQHRRHFPGTLLSVRPGVVSWIAGLFNMNERVVYMGHWVHGFFSMTAVGATNVGSIKVYFDKDLVTNTRMYKKHAFQDQCFQSNHNSEGIHLEKGDPFGEFNLGSTIVLIFEAPADFELHLHEGQKIKYGELICEHRSASG